METSITTVDIHSEMQPTEHTFGSGDNTDIRCTLRNLCCERLC